MATEAKTIAAWVTIGLTIVVVFATQAISADVRNRARDKQQDTEIQGIKLDVREMKTDMGYVKDDISDIKGYIKEQGSVNNKILNFLERARGSNVIR